MKLAAAFLVSFFAFATAQANWNSFIFLNRSGALVAYEAKIYKIESGSYTLVAQQNHSYFQVNESRVVEFAREGGASYVLELNTRVMGGYVGAGCSGQIAFPNSGGIQLMIEGTSMNNRCSRF